MIPADSPITLAQAFPALAAAVDAALHPLPLARVRRLRLWSAVVHTFALSAARRRDLVLGDLVAFPHEWLERNLDGEWHPARCRQMSTRTRRTLARAGLADWRDVLERTPQQMLEGTGAGLMTLCEVLSCAIELAAAWMTDPAERPPLLVFGVSRKNYPRRATGR